LVTVDGFSNGTASAQPRRVEIFSSFQADSVAGGFHACRMLDIPALVDDGIPALPWNIPVFPRHRVARDPQHAPACCPSSRSRRR
jgi:hypothetical protein